MKKHVMLLFTTFGIALVQDRAWSDGWEEGDEHMPPAPFQRVDAAIGGVKPASATPAYLTSSRIAIVGDRTLVSDADSGMLVLADARGAAVAKLAIGSDAGLLAYDPIAKRAYVADRRGDRIVVVTVGDTLAVSATWTTPAEPFGVALAPDRKTVLVTTIADRTLVAFDAATGHESWRAALDAESRGIAVAPDGKRALITSLTSGGLREVALVGEHVATRTALPKSDLERPTKGAFAVSFLGSSLAVTAFTSDTPTTRFPDSDHYGGSSEPPIAPQLAWFGSGGQQSLAITNVIEPRALAWDSAHDILYAVGMASPHVVAIDHASQVDVSLKSEAGLGLECGADGVAVDEHGGIRVWCAFSRSIIRFDLSKKSELVAFQKGPELVASTMDETHHAGFVLFHTGNPNTSGFGEMSCGSCHLDGRADGVSWFIKGRELQTPVLAGRVSGSGPFKWDGTAKDLKRSLRDTIGRLGGDGLSKKELGQLAAFVESIPAVRAPTRDRVAVARGKQLFESTEVGCTDCHDGPALTDGARHRFAGAKFDTPGLGALSASAPYFHDGSAPTLEAVLRERGSVHGMADAASHLSDADVADLVAFLETL
ncbi:MAG TPA: c-type cytochrome [Kofleriaceae bacterium]|jgi:sugar lactone lactonase YvrE/cytochrome c553|nr:c-type cytochrome [Kofleriaceae bacterium]